jgi:ubiquitin-protein ligase
MSAPRLRRLSADYEAVRAEFSGHPHVHVEPLGPHRPPEAYRVTLRVRGLRLSGNQPVAVDEHQLEIRLPASYPREKPLCTPITPVFHPNIKDYFCIQDYWAAGQSLVDTIAKISDMIQFRIYNPASPLDALAARWASQNTNLFPLGNVSLGTPEVMITLGSKRDRAKKPVPATRRTPASLPTLEEASPDRVAADEEDDLLISLRGSD